MSYQKICILQNKMKKMQKVDDSFSPASVFFNLSVPNLSLVRGFFSYRKSIVSVPLNVEHFVSWDT